jgi:hypothetical protein
LKMTTSKLRVGDWVEVQSKEEILRTLDHKAQLDGMPFMPEMLAFCGKRFQVYKSAHKTCDTVFAARGRRVDRAVHLSTRCDGQAHGGCQAGCLIFWKEAWLKRVRGPLHDDLAGTQMHASEASAFASACTESDLWRQAQFFGPNACAPINVCQATQLARATADLAWWDVRQYIEDYRSGNVNLWRMLRSFAFSLYYSLSQAGIGLGPAMRWFYDTCHQLWGGTPYPRKKGTVPKGQSTPAATLDLSPGELVRVKPYKEILSTLTPDNRNRGLMFDAEMVPYCGQVHRVLRRVTRIIDEKTGLMQEMKTPCVILDTVVCQSRYSSCRLFCPRGIYSYWREIWLERVKPGLTTTNEDSSRAPELADVKRIIASSEAALPETALVGDEKGVG